MAEKGEWNQNDEGAQEEEEELDETVIKTSTDHCRTVTDVSQGLQKRQRCRALRNRSQ